MKRRKLTIKLPKFYTKTFFRLDSQLSPQLKMLSYTLVHHSLILNSFLYKLCKRTQAINKRAPSYTNFKEIITQQY